jgi:glyoxylase-like metal-dependent hydrolase (beta-lactamase superfamily II)
MPFTVITTTNGVVTSSLRISSAAANVATDSLFNGVRKSKADDFPPPVAKIVELTPGVYRLEGALAGLPYNAVAVQQGDSIIMLEMPVSDEYARAILDSLRARFPRTPVKSFVVSHHHADHLGGVRAAFAAGLRAIVPEEIADYVRQVGLAPGQKSPSSRSVMAVRDTLAVGTGPTRFVLYHVPTSHARGFMLAYFPETKVLAEVDLAAGPAQDREDLFEFAQRRRITIDRLARIHGAVMPWETFVRSVPSQRAK